MDFQANSSFFDQLVKKRNDQPDLISCMHDVIDKLSSSSTSVKKPGVLLGNIQGGKTRAFIGVLALAFDKGYDVAIILTKGTKALSRQTIRRLEHDLEEFISNDKAQVFDVLKLPDNLAPYELKQKLIIVAKKEINNMQKIIHILENTYPDLSDKRILIIDDEADYASISYRKSSQGVEFGKISQRIDYLRNKTRNTDYLQVTATPYSLYLQPDTNIDESSIEFAPKRPAFTVLLPVHPGYVGSDFYFSESENEKSPAFYIYEEVSNDERDILKQADRRRFQIENALLSPKITVLRRAVLNFITGATIRRLQQENNAERPEKYSFVAHSEISKMSHKWQHEIITELVDQIEKAAKDDRDNLEYLVEESYRDLKKSISLIYGNDNIPPLEKIKEEVISAILEGQIMIAVVNSEKETEELLDEQGQLKLRTPMNIFIGGQILDRGITISNLIGFYYGRNPKRSQQDTVSQHSRMYGARKMADLVVTRFYTTQDIYNKMKTIHEFDKALREAFLKGANKNGVYFIRKDVSGKLVPCSPNKLLLSDITTLRPFRRHLPIGFQTDYKSKIGKTIDEIDKTVVSWFDGQVGDPTLVNYENIEKVIKLIESTLKFEEGYEWDSKSFLASIQHLSVHDVNPSTEGKVWVLIRKNRDLRRVREGGRIANSPDTPQREGVIASKYAESSPFLMLFRENGKEEDGWMGSPFWWPVLVTPKNMTPMIFASNTLDKDSIVVPL